MLSNIYLSVDKSCL